MLCGVIQGHEMIWVTADECGGSCRRMRCWDAADDNENVANVGMLNVPRVMRWRAAMLFVLYLWTVKGRLSWMKLDFPQCCVLLLYFVWLHFSRGAQQKYKIQKYFSLRPIFSCTQKVPTGFSYKLLVWKTHVSWCVWR